SVRVKGKIINSKKAAIAEFEDLGLGMGYTNFTPAIGDSYKAIVTINGQERTYDLPAVKTDGINVTLKDVSAQAVQLEIITSDSYLTKIQRSEERRVGKECRSRRS